MVAARPSKPASRIGGSPIHTTMRPSSRSRSITAPTRRPYSCCQPGSATRWNTSPPGVTRPWASLPPKRMNTTSGRWVAHVVDQRGGPVVEVGPGEAGGVLVVEGGLQQRDRRPPPRGRRCRRRARSSRRRRGRAAGRPAVGCRTCGGGAGSAASSSSVVGSLAMISPPRSSFPAARSRPARIRYSWLMWATSCTGCQMASDRSRVSPKGLRSARSTSASALTRAASPSPSSIVTRTRAAGAPTGERGGGRPAVGRGRSSVAIRTLTGTRSRWSASPRNEPSGPCPICPRCR